MSESQQGQNLRADKRLNKAEHFGFTFVKDVAVGEEIFLSYRNVLLSSMLLQLQMITSDQQNSFANATKLHDADCLTRQDRWDLAGNLTFSISLFVVANPFIGFIYTVKW